MATNDLTPHTRAFRDRRTAKPAPPGEPLRNRVPPMPKPSTEGCQRPQALRPRPRILDSRPTAPGPAEPAAPAVAHDAVSLMRVVLDADFEGGAHLACTDGVFRRFDRTHWRPLSVEELGRAILVHLPPGPNRGGRQARTQIREVVDLLKMQQATGPDRARLDDPLPILNVANAELWIRLDGSVELRPRNPASGQRYCLDVVYDPKADCPLYDRTLVEIFGASADPAALVQHWHEFVGYALQAGRPDARIFVAWGAGNDGKTALAGLLVRLLGPDRVAAMPVASLNTNRFALGHLADKALFLDDDVAVGTVLPDGVLKTISEAKIVTGEPKYRDAFEFRARALPLLLCNTAPRLNDASHGFYRRLFVMPCERRFTDAEADRTLFDRIWAAERSGVLNRALDGLRRVVQRGWKFEPSEVVQQATAAWWAEATGLPSPQSMPQRTPVPTRRTQVAVVQAPVAHSGRLPAPETHPITRDPGPNVNVRVALPEAGKGCTVHVRVGVAEVKVAVTAASPARGRPLQKLLEGR